MKGDDQIERREARVNGIRYSYLQAGEGPVVLFVHGFPELGHSWRHQLKALAAAGYRAIAPDLRGFGESEVTLHPRDYSIFQHARDLDALLEGLGVGQATVVGHDWGSNVMWLYGLLFPGRATALASLSIPFYPRPRDPAQMRIWSAGKFDFVRHFQRVGVTEAEFGRDPERFFRLFFHGLSGDAPAGTTEALYLHRSPEAPLLEGFPEPSRPPAWLSEEDLQIYVRAYRKTGIAPALGFYRNIEDDYPELLRVAPRGLAQPVLFIGGGREAAVKFGDLEGMKAALPDLRGVLVLPECGHWVQQERPEEVNRALLEFLRGLSVRPAA